MTWDVKNRRSLTLCCDHVFHWDKCVFNYMWLCGSRREGALELFYIHVVKFPKIGIRPLLESKIILIPSRKQILDPGMDITAFLKNYLESYCLNDIFSFYSFIIHEIFFTSSWKNEFKIPKVSPSLFDLYKEVSPSLFDFIKRPVRHCFTLYKGLLFLVKNYKDFI